MHGCLRRWVIRIFVQPQRTEGDHSENNYKWSLKSTVLLPVGAKI